jgi:pyruvate kinase
MLPTLFSASKPPTEDRADQSEAVLERLILQGMNVARLNFAHGTLQRHKEDIQRIRAVQSRLQRHCLIVVDLPGPKIRIGRLLDEPLLLEKGKKVILTVIGKYSVEAVEM